MAGTWKKFLTDSISNADWSGTDLAVVNGGTGASTASVARSNLGAASSTHTHSASPILQYSARLYTRYNYWYYPSTIYGTEYYNWNSTSSSVSLDTSRSGSSHPLIVLPANMKLAEYSLHFNCSRAETFELAILKGTPGWNGDTSVSLSQVGSTQSVSVLANQYKKMVESGAWSLSKGDILVPAFRRTTNPSSSDYAYMEGVLTLKMTESI